MVDTNIGRFAVAPILTPTLRIVAVPDYGPAADVDPVIIHPDLLKGTDGTNGVDGADGTDGTNGIDGATLRVAAGVPANALGKDGDQYTNSTNGDVYVKQAGAYVFMFNAKGPQGGEGPQGQQGAGLIPDQYGVFDEARITAIETAGVDWVFVVNPDGDTRVDKNVPASLVGDRSLHILRYDGDAGTWNDYGQFTGVKGEDGQKGDKGDKGDPGNNGTDGTNGTNGTDGVDGEDGKSAYASWLEQPGNAGKTEAQFVASLKGASGVADETVNTLTQAKLADIQATGIDWLFIVQTDGRPDKNVPLAISGDMAGNMLKYTAATNTFSVQGRWRGYDGLDGANGTPDATYSGFNEAVITSITNAAADWVFVVQADTRVDKAVPASLNGDKSGHMIRFRASDSSYLDLGQWRGADGESVPTYDCIIGRATGPIALGDYPITLHNPGTFVATTLAFQSGAGGQATFSILKNGGVLGTYTSTDTKQVVAINFAFAVGDVIGLSVSAANTNLLAVTLGRVL